MMRFFNRKTKDAAAFVLFRRNNDSLSEEFAGLARTESEAYSLAKILDSDSEHCLFERVRLEGWDGEMRLQTAFFQTLFTSLSGRGENKASSTRVVDLTRKS